MPQGHLLRKIKAHNELIQDISFAQDNSTIISGSLDKTIKLWDIQTGQNLYTQNLNSEVWSVDLVSDASIAGCADGTVRYYVKSSSDSKKDIKKDNVKPKKRGAKK